MTTPSMNYDIDDPNKIQGRDEIIPGARNIGEIRLERALEAISDITGRLLLLGAGAGRYARAIANARPDLTVVGGDLSHQAIREAVDSGGRPVYLVMDAQQIPCAGASFDAVLFFDLLEHVPSPAIMLAECARVLKPGHVLHFFVPLEDQPRTLYHALRRNRPIPIHDWKRDHVGHIQRFDQQDVVALVNDSGFDIGDLAHSFHLIGQIHDVIDYWQRERAAGGSGILPLRAVKLVTRGAFLFTWRLAYLEDRLYSGPKLASGLHVTARKPGRPAGKSATETPSQVEVAIV